MRRALSIAVLGLATCLAQPALANFEAKLKAKCGEVSEDDPSKLEKIKAANEDLISGCLEANAIDPTEESIAAHAVVFDSDTPPAGELRVIRRCDAAVICALSSPLVVQQASSMSGDKSSNDTVAFYELTDFVTGGMLCRLKDSYDASSDSFKFKASCSGVLAAGDTPCELKVKSGKLFEEDTGC